MIESLREKLGLWEKPSSKIKYNKLEDLRKIRVVLVEDKKGRKIFLSVMDKELNKERKIKKGAPHA